jgi:uncharacterized protein (TIGR03382 family)
VLHFWPAKPSDRADGASGRAGGWFQIRIVLLFGVMLLAAPTLAGVARADVIYDVNTALLNIIQNTSASLLDGPPEVANEIAMIDGAMYDAVNAATGSQYAPLNYTGGAASGANADAAALQAAVTVMNNLYVNPTTSLYQQFAGVTGANYFSCAILAKNPGYATDLVGPSIDQMVQVVAEVGSIQAELNAIPSTPGGKKGIALGTATANAAIAANNASGSQAAMVATLTPFVPPNEGQPGVYVPLRARPALQPAWGSVAPIGIPASSLTAIEQSVPGPKPLGSTAYASEVLQTECEGPGTALPSSIETACTAAGFTPESPAEAQAALFWNDPGGTLQPPGHWLQITDTITNQEDLSLTQVARATALAAIAMNDAGIAVWEVKYQVNAWRPFTAIQDCSTDTAAGTVAWSSSFTTCDTSWSSLIATPPHPDYLAGHPAFSGAAATALADAIGTDNVTFSSTSNAYCNTGKTTLDSEGYIIGCTVGTQFYSIAGATCAGGGTLQFDGDGNVVGCMVGLEAESVTGGDCNNAGSVPVLDPDGSLNPAYNASPLICPIAEAFDTISQASGGFLGAEFSRVVGGIHTPDAVTDALVVGNEIGNLVASEDLLPEPPMAPTLAVGLLILGVLRHRRRERTAIPGAV